MRSGALWLGLAILGASTATGSAGTTPAPPTAALEDDVLPILKARCVKCHGPAKREGKLSLSTPKALARGGENGAVVVPGQLDESLLWEKVDGDEMPPQEPLPAAEKATLRRWIEQGAVGLPRLAPGEPVGADHWAFATATRPDPPRPRDEARLRTDIDRFIEAALEARGLSLALEADRGTLLRRVSFDLTGLPPAPEEVATFLADRAPDAYERMVERHLASPHYGERRAKFWLDAAGYADSNGYFSADTDRPLAYRYRDYVIRSYNADKPLDLFVREQLAGDEMANGRPAGGFTPEAIDRLVATHFLRNAQDGTGESDGNPDEVRADRFAVLEGAVQIIGSTLLGLTLQCARCHDHKFEPVTQREYYQLQAILSPAFNLERWVKPNDRFVVAAPPEEQARWDARGKQLDAELARLRSELAALSKGQGAPGKEETKPAPDDKGEPAQGGRKALAGALKAKAERHRAAIKALEAERAQDPGKIAWVSDLSGDPSPVHLLKRGNYAEPGPEVAPAALAILTDPDNAFRVQPPYPGATGRRLAFARWLTRPGSRPAALLARVLANRIWQEHFGTGIVATSENLGYSGAPPSHPGLLDYLAFELAHQGWSARALHRLILRSAVYRQSGAARPEALRSDPEDRLLARFPLRRLDAESLRDALLAASGELDRRMGGPYVPTQRTESGEVVVAEDAEGARRRSVYLQQRRTQVASILDVFDAPSIVTTCTRRGTSTIPLQSLSLLNSDFVLARARRLAERVERSAPNVDGKIDRAFLLAIGRGPAADECDAARRFLQAQPSRYPGRADAEKRAWIDFCQMILASNASLYVD